MDKNTEEFSKKKKPIYHKRYYHKPQHFMFQQDSDMDDFYRAEMPEMHSRFPVFSTPNLRSPTYHRHTILCSNCNEKGHFFKDCTKPILSYGILGWTLRPRDSSETLPTDTIMTFESMQKLYQTAKAEADLYITLIQRKHTIGYEAFIRGKYNNESELEIHLSRMTKDERNAIKSRSWDDLYDEIIAEKDLRYMQKEKRKAKLLYESLDLPRLLEKSESDLLETSWEFPKGRRFVNETDFHCALREFQEETNITKDDIIWINSSMHFKEEFCGTNQKIYLNKYFNALVQPNCNPYIDLDNPSQLSEVKNAKWFTYQEAMNILHSYCQEKKDVLSESYRYIQSVLGQIK